MQAMEATEMEATERIYRSPHPSIGLVIGTYAALPYIHLQLESWFKHCRNMPLLIHDDCSPQRDELEALCRDYGAEFYSNRCRRGHVVGDMVVVTHGLRWAEERGVDILAKFSRRFVPLIPWQNALSVLAYRSQHATFSGHCDAHGFGFRTEAMAMHVRSWLDYGGLDPIQSSIDVGEYVLVEGVVHQGAGLVQKHACKTARCYEAENPTPANCGGYADWSLLGTNRMTPRAEVLWHESCRPVEYHRALVQYGVRRYSAEDFVDPEGNIHPAM